MSLQDFPSFFHLDLLAAHFRSFRLILQLLSVIWNSVCHLRAIVGNA